MTQPAHDLPTDFDVALADACAGGSAGLTFLFRRYHPRVLRYLRTRVPRLADDISGETWLAIATRIPHFEGDERSFGSWVFVIARQRLADARRTGARRHTDPFADVAEHGQGPSTRDAGPSTEDLALDGLDAQGAVDLIARLLTADQAEVVLLRTLGGLSVADVAATLGRNEGWVRVTHHRAVQRLQDRLAPRMVAWQREGVAGAR